MVAFFQIAIAPQDKDCFAFTVWKPNTHKPAKRYQWTMLPQGMKNNLTICQLYVSWALVHITKDILLIHYMNDLLLAHLDVVYL